jgi:hypothetical protein
MVNGLEVETVLEIEIEIFLSRVSADPAEPWYKHAPAVLRMQEGARPRYKRLWWTHGRLP